jgi:hypothetical protein
VGRSHGRTHPLLRPCHQGCHRGRGPSWGAGASGADQGSEGSGGGGEEAGWQGAAGRAGPPTRLPDDWWGGVCGRCMGLGGGGRCLGLAGGTPRTDSRLRAEGRGLQLGAGKRALAGP